MGVRKGFLFSIDALIASIILVSSMLIFSNLYIEEKKTIHLSLLSDDILNIMSEMKITEINNSYVDELIAQGDITNLNNTIIEQIGELWALNKTNLTQKLIKNITFGLFPSNFGFSFVIGDEEVYKRDFRTRRYVVAARKMISGYGKGRPVKGSTARAYLNSIQEKETFAYAYFGGFVGQGKLFRQLEYIPSDAVIESIFIEVDAASDFEIWINNVHCDDISPGPSGNMTAEMFNISSCNSLLDPGEYNNISIIFQGDISESYFAGGMVKVAYTTSELIDPYANSTFRYYLPGIDGIANLYSSFYVPGILNSMHVHLHFESENPTLFTIGDTIVFQNNGSATPEIIDIDNATLSSAPISLDYQGMAQQTVPIRFASYNLTNSTVLVSNADVILITDMSGSMKKSTEDWTLGNSAPDCTNYFNNPDTRRTRAAVCLDKELVAVVMNYSGNRIWPVFFSGDTNDDVEYLDEPQDETAINIFIDTYYNDQGKEKTCLACAINKGYDFLDQYSSNSRQKFMIVMSDGSPTHCAQGSCTSNSTIYGDEQCAGLCDTSGVCNPGEIPGQCTACTNNPGATNNAYYSAQRARDDLNVTIYTVGFGPVDDCVIANETLRNISQIGGGTYQNSKNISKLREIYQNLSREIINSAQQVSQTVSVLGNITNSILYPDSYIEMNFTSMVAEPEFGEITFAFESDKFQGCTDYVNILPKMRILDAKVISYSGPHWTSNVTVNDQNIFLLQDYSYNFLKLGDPYAIYVPPSLFQTGNNSISIMTADTPVNITGCSRNNSLIYTASVRTTTSYSEVLEFAEGCTWMIETEESGTIIAPVPLTYSGPNLCYYNSTNMVYNDQDSIDMATYGLLLNLDFDNDGKININIAALDLKIQALWVSQVPYLWGPAIVEVRTWQ